MTRTWPPLKKFCNRSVGVKLLRMPSPDCDSIANRILAEMLVADLMSGKLLISDIVMMYSTFSEHTDASSSVPVPIHCINCGAAAVNC